MKKHLTLLLAMAITGLTAHSENERKEIEKVVDEVVIVASPKETASLKRQPMAVSLYSTADLDARQVSSITNLTSICPNLYIPDYGSSLTSAIYIRGVGSRINTPAVGLYVDNMPYLDKSAFNFNLYDIERIDVLRGPQGTLYGRNTMGGLIKVHTPSPFEHQGTRLRLGFSAADLHRTLSLTHHQRISDTFAFSVGGYYKGGEGFFRNDYTGERIDAMQAVGGRLRAIWELGERWSMDFTANCDYTDEGAYPYYYLGASKSSPEAGVGYEEYVGAISYNDAGLYHRQLINGGLNVEYRADAFTLNAVTGYQYLTDQMAMDQDFLPVDLYTLEQEQRLQTLNEELTIKSLSGKRWQWVSGVTASMQQLGTSAPVTFKAQGVKEMIEDNVNSVFEQLRAENPRMPQMGLDITADQLLIAGQFDTPLRSAALFHQSTINDILTEGLALTLGLRAEYEHLSIDYNTGATIPFDFNVSMSPAMQIPIAGLSASPNLQGNTAHGYWQLLPKVALSYETDDNTYLYAAMSKGYRSGGYNVQLFSDLVRSSMKNALTDGIIEGAPSSMQGMIAGMINGAMPGRGESTDVDGAVYYKPEESLNYEVGIRTSLFDRSVTAEASAFYIDTRNQQIARFVGSGLGRTMVNAGRSRSIGVEASLAAHLTTSLTLHANYGFTYATFVDYNDSIADYAGNLVPFIPRHTLNVGATYAHCFAPNSYFHSLECGLYYTGAGRIYWDESNTLKQPFYGTLTAQIALHAPLFDIRLWGHNLTNARYHTFSFESMGRLFAQQGNPLNFGIEVSIKL